LVHFIHVISVDSGDNRSHFELNGGARSISIHMQFKEKLYINSNLIFKKSKNKFLYMQKFESKSNNS